MSRVSRPGGGSISSIAGRFSSQNPKSSSRLRAQSTQSAARSSQTSRKSSIAYGSITLSGFGCSPSGAWL